jgi:hypothetical protein
VLRRGGRLGVACWAAVEQTPFGADAEALTRHMGDEVGSMMHSPFVLGDPEAVGKLLADAGFEDVAARVETIECVFASHTGFARRSIGAGPIDPLFRAAPPAVQQAIEDDVTRALEPFAQPDGTLRAPMPTVIAVGTTPSSS